MESMLSKPYLSPIELAQEKLEHFAHMTFSVQEVLGNKAQNRYLLQVGERRFYVGFLIYQILLHIRSKQSLEDLTQKLNFDFDNEDCKLEISDIARIINEQITQLFDSKTAQSQTSVKSIFNLMNPAKINFLLKPLALLFNKSVFRILFGLSVIINILFFVILRLGITTPEGFVYTSFQQNFIFFFIIIGFLVFHELGHAAASHRFGVPPGKIGFGIYFIFPAFYTDLTAVWSLNKKERVVINLGGIYFQLLINLILIAFLFMYQQDEVIAYFLKKAILINCLVSLYNLNPFFKFDGYWIYSDYFDIPNLRKQANELINQTLRFLGHYFWNKKLSYNFTSNSRQYPLLLYALGYTMFMASVWFYISRFLYRTHINLYYFFVNTKGFNINSLADWTTLIPLVFLICIAWTTAYFIIRKIYLFRKSWLTIS